MPSRVRVRILGPDGHTLNGPAAVEWVQRQLPYLVRTGWIKEKGVQKPKSWRDLPKAWAYFRRWFSEYAPFVRLEIWRERRGTRIGLFQSELPKLRARTARVAPVPQRQREAAPPMFRFEPGGIVEGGIVEVPRPQWAGNGVIQQQQPQPQVAPPQPQPLRFRIDEIMPEFDAEWRFDEDLR